MKTIRGVVARACFWSACLPACFSVCSLGCSKGDAASPPLVVRDAPAAAEPASGPAIDPQSALDGLVAESSSAKLADLLAVNKFETGTWRVTLAPKTIYSADENKGKAVLVQGSGEDKLVVAVARFFPTEPGEGLNPEASTEIGYVFDSHGKMLWHVGNENIGRGSKVKLVNLGPGDDWFLWVESPSDPPFDLDADLLPIAKTELTALSLTYHRDSTSFTTGPKPDGSPGRISFFSQPRPTRVPIQAECPGGQTRDAVLTWDTKTKKFTGCEEMRLKETVLFKVDLKTSMGFVKAGESQ